MEPSQLKRGKEFHRRVQEEWSGEIAGAPAKSEKTVEHVNAPDGKLRRGKGRIDIWVSQVDDFVSVFEIKATDWDKIKPGNVRRNLSSHVRQALAYVDVYLVGKNINVVAAIVYPNAPRTPGLLQEIETYLNDAGFQVVWFDDPPNT